MTDVVENLDGFRKINDSEIKELEKVLERRDYSVNWFLDTMEVRYIRQGNFTICLLYHNGESYAGAAKKHNDYDPSYNEEAGKKLSLVRAFDNMVKLLKD